MLFFYYVQTIYKKLSFKENQGILRKIMEAS